MPTTEIRNRKIISAVFYKESMAEPSAPDPLQNNREGTMEYRSAEAQRTRRNHIQPFKRGTFIPRCLATALLLGMFAGCGAATAGEVPGSGGTELQRAWPEDRGVDSSKLVSLSEWLRTQNLDVHSLLVVKDDK